MSVFVKHSFTFENHQVTAYWYEDRYRYTVFTENGIEYREMQPSENLQDIKDFETLEAILINDIKDNPYGSTQFSNKCVRCSKQTAFPRKQYNLAPLCNRCYDILLDCEKNKDFTGFNTFYSINDDGSKGSLISTKYLGESYGTKY